LRYRGAHFASSAGKYAGIVQQRTMRAPQPLGDLCVKLATRPDMHAVGRPSRHLNHRTKTRADRRISPATNLGDLVASPPPYEQAENEASANHIKARWKAAR